MRRVLSDGGVFLIVNEDDGLSGNNEKWEKIIDGMHTYTPDELKTHLTAAIAVLGIWLCAKVDKKSSKLLD